VDALPEDVEVAVANATIQQNAFLFCRYSIAVLIWAALIVQSLWLLALVLFILALSAFLTVRRAPMVWLYTSTLGALIPSRDVVLDVDAMRFAHTLGAVLATISIALVYWSVPGAWYFVGAFAVLKTVSAFGFCPASKLYGCVIKDGGCCALTARR
jgi:hypothetical protein